MYKTGREMGGRQGGKRRKEEGSKNQGRRERK
jgi:hypothetical protein